MQFTHLLFTTLMAATALATPLLPRADQQVSGDEVTDTTCTNPSAAIDTHDTNVAILSICGGIAGSIQKCGGAPSSTTGESGTARFDLAATDADAGARINVSKGRWERCVKAAQQTCPQGEFESTCVGGATSGDVKFSLSQA
ncbi:uncharacterized protein BKCO1_1040003 [Diplodia corticola]|uniref:Uncharacterized protein n=1 Tax=Diplodia corticola TaxID=236234 RepID=A0A1J9QK95_9PEZI|nr:uncharacterized protein BKCO1_1040003 [Diplodia corticola]OJD28896.1 hypothetical protein BKCO1_1040003 [Diplodia corticola]